MKHYMFIGVFLISISVSEKSQKSLGESIHTIGRTR